MIARLVSFLVAVLVVAPACAADFDFPASATPARTLVIGSTTDIGIIRPVIVAWQKANPSVAIRYRELTTNALFGEAKAACEGDAPADDVVLSSAMDLQAKLVNDGCAVTVDRPGLNALPDFARWRSQLFGLTYEPAVIVYNRRAVAAHEAPTDHFALLDLLRQPGRFEGRIGTYDIEASGLGYLFATLDDQRSSTWGRLIEAMGRNHVRLYCCTQDILDRVADGRLTLGYNVLGSYALAEARRKPDLAVAVPSDYTLVLTRAAFVPRQAANRADAEAFLEFTQGPEGRRILNEEALLFSPIDGEDQLFKALDARQQEKRAIRPIGLGPALIVGLDQMKRRLFLKQWRDSLGIGED
ncbi:ABC transporter substrate-binding protein [Oricola sp.]|uniref:ABC transporter substrate-binding protein n=1 Tax=Oricola sp. TaxID=1979950 RepID=UPI0025DB5A0C|nr:ABC transporter substrate-binding protein [Oricola sp.]MCI5077827.1 ABC transporter substrate-binding protein [Oricola sp.]